MTALMAAPTDSTVNDDRAEVVHIPATTSEAPLTMQVASHANAVSVGIDIDLSPAPAPGIDDDWRTFAVCATDPEPDRWIDLPPVRIHGRNNPAYDARLDELAAVCSTCPVMDTCLGQSLAMNVRGVFAGHDEYDRADMRESLGLPTPPLMPPPETEDDARLIEQQFTALRLARRGLTNKQIAAELDVSTMTVSRLLASEDRPAKRRSRKAS